MSAVELGREDFTRRMNIGNSAMALVGQPVRVGHEPDSIEEREEYASDLISDVLTSVYGDPRVAENRLNAQLLLNRAILSYHGDAEDYDWEVTA